MHPPAEDASPPAPASDVPAPDAFPLQAWLFIPLMIPVATTIACAFAQSLVGTAISVVAAAVAAIVWPLIMAIVVWCRSVAHSDTGGWSALTTLIRGWLVGGTIWLILIYLASELGKGSHGLFI